MKELEDIKSEDLLLDDSMKSLTESNDILEQQILLLQSEKNDFRNNIEEIKIGMILLSAALTNYFMF